MCQRHAKTFVKATASKVVPKSSSELASMSGENVREKLNDMDGTRPITYVAGRIGHKTSGLNVLLNDDLSLIRATFRHEELLE